MQNHGGGIFGCHNASAICFLSLGSKLPSAKFMKILDELDNYMLFLFSWSRIGQTCQREFNLIKQMLLHGSRRQSFVWSWAYFMKDIPMHSASPMKEPRHKTLQGFLKKSWGVKSLGLATVFFHIHESPNIPIGFLPTCWHSSLDTHLNPLRSIYTTKKTTYRGETVEEVVSLEGFVDILKIYNWMIRFAISYRMTNKCFCPKWCKSKFIDGV